MVGASLQRVKYVLFPDMDNISTAKKRCVVSVAAFAQSGWRVGGSVVCRFLHLIAMQLRNIKKNMSFRLAFALGVCTFAPRNGKGACVYSLKTCDTAL